MKESFGTIGLLNMLLSPCRLRSDTIELKSGERLDGTFRQAGAAGVVFQAAGQVITIPVGKVRAIYFGDAKPKAESGPAPAQEALDALRGLRSATEVGISFANYAPRVLDANVHVDKYIRSAVADAVELRDAIALAMKEYILSVDSWNASIAKNEDRMVAIGERLVRDKEMSKCALIHDKIETWTAVVKDVHDRFKYLGQKDENLQALWGCASLQIDEAERLVVNRH